MVIIAALSYLFRRRCYRHRYRIDQIAMGTLTDLDNTNTTTTSTTTPTATPTDTAQAAQQQQQQQRLQQQTLAELDDSFELPAPPQPQQHAIASTPVRQRRHLSLSDGSFRRMPAYRTQLFERRQLRQRQPTDTEELHVSNQVLPLAAAHPLPHVHTTGTIAKASGATSAATQRNKQSLNTPYSQHSTTTVDMHRTPQQKWTTTFDAATFSHSPPELFNTSPPISPPYLQPPLLSLPPTVPPPPPPRTATPPPPPAQLLSTQRRSPTPPPQPQPPPPPAATLQLAAPSSTLSHDDNSDTAKDKTVSVAERSMREHDDTDNEQRAQSTDDSQTAKSHTPSDTNVVSPRHDLPLAHDVIDDDDDDDEEIVLFETPSRGSPITQQELEPKRLRSGKRY